MLVFTSLHIYDRRLFLPEFGHLLGMSSLKYINSLIAIAKHSSVISLSVPGTLLVYVCVRLVCLQLTKVKFGNSAWNSAFEKTFGD